jgi:cytochrome c
VIGESDAVTTKGGLGRPPQGVDPTAWRRANYNKAQIKLSSVSGIHDVYFIFKNPDAKAEEVLMSVTEIAFLNLLAPPAVEN